MSKPLSPAVDRCVPNDTLENCDEFVCEQSNEQFSVEMAPEWETMNVKVNDTSGNPRSYRDREDHGLQAKYERTPMLETYAMVKRELLPAAGNTTTKEIVGAS